MNTDVEPGRGPYGWGMSLSEFSGRTVLVVDDEPMVREVVTTYLTRDGLDVTEAADGASALRAFEKSRPDLIVLDVMLPEIDGYSLLSEVRSRSNVPVIMLTARGEETDRQKEAERNGFGVHGESLQRTGRPACNSPESNEWTDGWRVFRVVSFTI